MMQRPLVDEPGRGHALADGLFLCRALADSATLAEDMQRVIACAPWRHMQVPGGGRMSVAMSNCGALGWVSDASGYRYTRIDPLTALPWPPLPPSFSRLATELAARAGFSGFEPDACLINRYAAGCALGLHQDRNEADFSQPIVSVSIGAAAEFLWGGPRRADCVRKLRLQDGDVLVWGGPARLNFHGVAPLRPHAADDVRVNLTLRCAGTVTRGTHEALQSGALTRNAEQEP
jgi:DNA oxidative demethylase